MQPWKLCVGHFAGTKRAEMERHEGGCTVSSLAIVVGWILWGIPCIALLSVAHVSWGFGHPESEGTKQVVCWPDSGSCGQHIYSERFLASLWIMTFHIRHEHTHTLTYTYAYIPGLAASASCRGASSAILTVFFIASLSLLFLGLIGISIVQSPLWPGISQVFSACDCSFHPEWLFSPCLIRDACGEYTYFRCWSCLSPVFGIRGCSASAPIHLLMFSAHLLFLTN